MTNKKEETIKAAAKSLLGGYESHEDYNYVRGRGESFNYIIQLCS